MQSVPELGYSIHHAEIDEAEHTAAFETGESAREGIGETEERRKNIKRKRISATSIQASAKAFIAGVDYPNGFSAGDNGIGVRPHKALY